MNRKSFDTHWMRDASCARIPGLPWTDSGKLPPLLVDLMAQTCAACPVLGECEEFVDRAEVTAGWWAGASRNDRQPWDRFLPQPAVDPDAA